jgi:hypothetical protein
VLEDLLAGAGRSIVFGLVGIGLMALGFLLVDLLTPGKLRDLIWVDRNPNAALLLAANQLGIAAIVFTAVFTSYDSFGQDWPPPSSSASSASPSWAWRSWSWTG